MVIYILQKRKLKPRKLGNLPKVTKGKTKSLTFTTMLHNRSYVENVAHQEGEVCRELCPACWLTMPQLLFELFCILEGEFQFYLRSVPIKK